MHLEQRFPTTECRKTDIPVQRKDIHKHMRLFVGWLVCEYVCVCGGVGVGVDSQCLSSAGADVGIKEVKFDPTGANQVIITA